MIRIEIEVETSDPALRDYILGDVESWRRTTATVSVSTTEEGTSTVSFSSSISMGAVATGRHTDDAPPEPPPLPLDRVHALIDWADSTASWLREEIAEAERHGHREHGGTADQLRLYEGVGVLFREAYETRTDEL